MKKLLIIISLFPVVAFAAPDASDVRAVQVPDAKGNNHNAGPLTQTVINYASSAAAQRASAKAAIEAKISGGKPSADLASIKAEIDILEASGGSIDPSKKTLVTNSVAIEAQKRVDAEKPDKGQ